MVIFPQTHGGFEVYLRQDDAYILYTKAKDGFTEWHRKKLFDHGVAEVYIAADQKESFESYLEGNLGPILQNEQVPIEVRSKILHDVSHSIVQETYQTRLPADLDTEHLERIKNLVNGAISFLTLKDSLKSMGSLISHDYKTYSHSLQVMIYTISVLNEYGYDQKELMACGLGALLHDIGKTRISKDILEKRGKLTKEEWVQVKKHPTWGVGLVARMPLSQTTINCIMFHHEWFDGQGYPTGLEAEDIPLPARVVCACDAYDAMTSKRPYSPARTAFEALSEMRRSRYTQFDPEVYTRLVMVLSGADLA